MRTLREVLISGLVLFLLASCSRESTPPQPVAQFKAPAHSDEALVWQSARLAVPVRGTVGSMITTVDAGFGLLQLTGAGPNTQWPVILIAEGCGMESPPRLLRALAEQGFVALSLSSKARQHVPLKCAENLQTPKSNDILRTSKQAELNYALRSLTNLPWADTHNIFLLGFDEGTSAVAQMSSGAVRARVLVNWQCEGAGLSDGADPSNSAVLAVFTTGSTQSQDTATRCEALLRANPQNQYMRLSQAYPLNVLLEPIAFTQLLQFLDRQIFR